MLDAWLAELSARNLDNVARTDSYLELYAWTRDHPPDLPWVLMAHLVSRNAGYLMGDVRRALDDPRTLASARPMLSNLFGLLERSNFLIFWDAWHHLLHHLLGRTRELSPARTSAFVRGAWQRYEARRGAGDRVDATVERQLVLDLVTNEQTLIEHHSVHHPDYSAGRLAVGLMELLGRERSLHFPGLETDIRVGWFSNLTRRIDVGRQIFDEVIADRRQRDALYRWCLTHPHTGSRAVYGGRDGPTVREAWPLATVRATLPGVHAGLDGPPSF